MKLDETFVETEAPDIRPYKRLWRAVVMNALKDALQFKQGACTWLTTPSRDRAMVFEFAGIDEQYTQERMLVVLGLLAKSLARGTVLKVDRQTGRVWREKASSEKCKNARTFLRSQNGRRASAALRAHGLQDPLEEEAMLAEAYRVTVLGEAA